MVIAFSCKRNAGFLEQNKVSYDYELAENGKGLSYSLDEDTKYQFVSLFPYEERNGKTYLTFMNSIHEILFYDLPSGEFLFKTKIEPEGPDGITGPSGYYVISLDSIYVTTLSVPTLYSIDQNGTVLQRINYGETESGYTVIPTFNPNSFFYTPLFVINHELYITQKPSWTVPVSSTPVSVVINPENHLCKELPFFFPPLIKDEEFGHVGGFALSFSREFDGEKFIYSFYYDEAIYVAPVDHSEIRKYVVKSKYIDHVKVVKKRKEDMFLFAKNDYKDPCYGNLLYDKYRNIYYRLAYPKAALEEGVNYVAMTAQGRKKFSIIVLDEKFNIMGETLFPEYIYNPILLFVHPDGLYICDNHIMNPSFKEDVLSFKCFELVKK
jgi:hypothetical protein